MNKTWTEKVMQNVGHSLIWLRAQTEADVCILSDSAGNVIERYGSGAWNVEMVTALAAGVYGASRELARILGQNEFDSVLNQGEGTNICFQSVTEDLLLIVIFSETTSAGLVKAYTSRTAALIGHLLTESASDSATEERPPLLLINNEETLFNTITEQDLVETMHRQNQVAKQI